MLTLVLMEKLSTSCMALGHQGNHSKLKTKSKTTNFIMAQRKGYSDKTNLDLCKYDEVITSKNKKEFYRRTME